MVLRARGRTILIDKREYRVLEASRQRNNEVGIDVLDVL